MGVGVHRVESSQSGERGDFGLAFVGLATDRMPDSKSSANYLFDQPMYRVEDARVLNEDGDRD